MKEKRVIMTSILSVSALALISSPVVASDQTYAPPQPSRDANAAPQMIITDPVTRFILPNGLKVVVQSNRRLPLVTAALSYNVGSKDEQMGEHGYAHLFEHLMIDGSANWNQDALRSFGDMGATNSNATTTQDTTLFYETFPRAALERVLFLEADRMGNIAGALTPDRIKKEVGVVLSELRLRRGQSFGNDQQIFLADLYQADHPYYHDVGGQEADLNAVTVDAARKWFDRYYGPSNVTLVLTGDVAPSEARALVQKYFGGLSPRLPIDQLLTRSPVLAGPIRRQSFQEVPLGRIYAIYLAPAAGSPSIAELDLIAQMMANGARSRLNRRLVEELRIAQSAEVIFDEGVLSSRMGFAVSGVPGDKMERAEAELDAVLNKFVTEGPAPDELERARTARLAYMESTQSSTFGKALLLTRNASLSDGAEYAEVYSRQIRDATPESIRRTAQDVYGRPGYRLLARPTPALTATEGGYDLTKGPPAMGDLTPIAFPSAERMRLSNGLKVVLVSRPHTATDSFLLRFDSGSAGKSNFVSQIAFDLMAGKAPTKDQRQRGERAEALQGWLSSAVEPDRADLRLSFAAGKLTQGVALLGEVLAQPGISQDAVNALRDTQLAMLSGEKNDNRAAGKRAMLNALYGAEHPYGRTENADDDIKTVEAINADMVREWSSGHLRPDRATLYVAADAEPANLRLLLEKALAGWKSRGQAAPILPISPAQAAAAPTLTVIDRPGQAQSYVQAARVLPNQKDETEALATNIVNQIYGGGPSARIGANLRTDKGWSYGTDSSIYDTRGQRRWLTASLVDGAHTGEAIAELKKEIAGLADSHPPEQSEIDRVVSRSANRAAARLEGNEDILTEIADSESNGQPYDYSAKRPAHMRALTLDQVRSAAAAMSDTKLLHWVIVGDWQKIKGQLQGLNIGDPVVITAAK